MGSSSPWDSRESGRRGRSPTPGRIPGVSSGVNEGTPPQIASDSMIAASIDIDDLVKASTFDELAPSFVFTKDRDHDELDMEPADVIEKTVNVSEQIEADLSKTFGVISAKVVAQSISYTTAADGDGDDQEPLIVTISGRAKMAVADMFREIAMS